MKLRSLPPIAASCCSSVRTVALVSMAPLRVAAVRDVESALSEESPTTKKPVGARDTRFPLTRWEAAAAASVFTIFAVGLFCIFLTMPEADYDKIFRLPHNLADLRVLKDNIAVYARDYQAKFMLGYCATYIFMQTFMIPGTIFMSLLAGSLFGVVKGVVLVVFTATSGASSCYFLSKLIGRPLVSWLWPEKLRFFQAESLDGKGAQCQMAGAFRFLALVSHYLANFAGVSSGSSSLELVEVKEELERFKYFLEQEKIINTILIKEIDRSKKALSEAQEMIASRFELEASMLKMVKDKLSKVVGEASDRANTIEKKAQDAEAALKRSVEENARLLNINKTLVTEVEELKARSANAKVSKAEALNMVKMTKEKMAMLICDMEA
ncbi:putative uncharacterized membrane protein [Cocos nucifera]|uniref:Uncharacterized membrane protein n=1 Tax=Cocos nucifera TaxID=13894 RepID=A0A8K0HZ96_COCNU|nr:putative uncharacterized membrane protein [Cocos nucifera]